MKNLALILAVVSLGISLVVGVSVWHSKSLGAFTTSQTVLTDLQVTGQLQVGDAVSSTAQIGAVSKSGCIILGDSSNGANPVYITATGATITAATTTRPAACKTAN